MKKNGLMRKIKSLLLGEWMMRGPAKIRDRYKDCWESLKYFLREYNNAHGGGQIIRDGAAYGRYCVAISIEDLLEEMDKIEGN